MNKVWNTFLKEGELRAAGIVVCIDEEDRVLIIRRSNIDGRGGQWTIPGGHIDESDRSIEAGAVRELDEETDLLCNTRDLIYLGEPKKDTTNSEIPIYLLEKALEMSKNV